MGTVYLSKSPSSLLQKNSNCVTIDITKEMTSLPDDTLIY